MTAPTIVFFACAGLAVFCMFMAQYHERKARMWREIAAYYRQERPLDSMTPTHRRMMQLLERQAKS